MKETEEKLERVRTLMDDRGLDAVLITRNDNFSWLTGGGRGWVARSSEVSVGWILVTREKAYLLTDNIEYTRLLTEELPEGFEGVECKWYEELGDLVKKVAGSGNIGSDDPARFTFIGDDLRKLRYVLTPWEIEKVKKFGEELERVFEESLERAVPDMTEMELAGLVEGELRKKGFEVPVLLVFSEESRLLYRHNLPRDVKLGKFFFVSICAGKYGLILSSTRTMAFGEVSEDLLKQHEKNALIEAEMIASTVPGRTLGEMFEIIKKVYEKNGVGDEFEKHHQGGIAGYNPREEKALPGSETVLRGDMLVAWNPTITGTKSEDTFLTGDENEVLTFTSSTKWPVLEFEINGKKIRRPGVRVI